MFRGIGSLALILCLFVSAIITSESSAGEQPGFLVHVSPRSCTHGLHPQPNGGPFSVFVFCDDAAGVNIGVILTERGAGPGKLPLDDPTKIWDKWDATNRFWQDASWAADVTSFAWSPTYRYLYVATSEVYGSGTLFKLDLKNRTYKSLAPEKYRAVGILANEKRIPRTTIIAFNPTTEEMILEVLLGSSENDRHILKGIKVE